MSKEISNPYSTGGGGIHFENSVQSAFTVLMLAGGFAPCLPSWPITEIKLQGKYQGYETDDLIVRCNEPNTTRKSKLLGQVKHTISFTASDQTLREVLAAAWADFNNKEAFSEETGDAIALICGPLSGVDTDSVRPLLEQARSSKDSNDFINRVGRGKFTSNEQREKLEVFKGHLKTANNDTDLTNDQLWRFLKSFYLLIYDLDIKGVVHSLLHTLIELYSKNNSNAIWAQINDHVKWISERAGFISLTNIPEEIKTAFKKIQVETIPEDFVKDTSKIVISDWNDSEIAPELALACIVGSWNENIVADKSILSRFAGLEYEKWISKLRDVLQYPESPLEFKNGIWHVKKRLELWQSLGSRIFDDHLNTLQECAVLVLTEKDPKFELPKEDRFAAKVHGKILNYSNQIRKGLAEALALAGCLSDALINTSIDKPNSTAVLTIREIFDKSDWILWASLNDLLPTLAEAAPDEFIKFVEDKLTNESILFTNLFAQEGGGISGWNYMTGLLWALETLAWEETYLVNVTILLGELANLDPGGNWANRPSNSLTTIFLPWLPQTIASIEKRKVAVKTLDKELPEISWKLLLSLLPNAHQVSSQTRKPSFRNSIPADWNEKVTSVDYWKQVEYYAELAVENAKDNVDRLEKLIDNLDNLPRPVFENLLSHLSSEKITNQSDELKVNLWNALIDFTAKHKRYSDAKWALNVDIIVKIDEVANKLSPKDPLYSYARLFGKRDIDLYEEKGNWEEQHKKLDERRQQAIKEILDKSGIDEVFKFLDNVESPANVGNALGAISNDSTDKKLLPFYLDTEDKKIKQFVTTYVWRKYIVSSWSWVDKMINMPWTKVQIAHFLTCLPFIFETWKRVSEKLSDSESLYWEKTNVNPFQSDTHLTVGIDKLIKYGRPHTALDCLQKELYDKKPLDIQRALNALNAALKSQEQPYNMDTYNITEVIKALQDNNLVSEDDLFNIEWAYLPLLDEHTGVTPKTLELRLASDADFYCEVIRTIYRSKKVSKEEKKEPSDKEKAIATNAWHLLYKWKTTPGTQKDGSLNEVQFIKWLKYVWEKCTETGHLEVALQYVGKVLFYSPADPLGFWINKAVADELNRKDADELRSGFSMEVFNSRGSHIVDPTGRPELELADEYKTKSEEAENAGYQRFAVTLRKISESYESEAKQIIDDHNREFDDQ